MIRKLNNNWAPVEDSLTAQLVKSGGRMLWRKIHMLMVSVEGSTNARGVEIVPSYAQCIKRVTRWSVITTK